MKNALGISLTAHVLTALVWAQLVSFRHVQYVPRDVTTVQLVSLDELKPKPKPIVKKPIPQPVVEEIDPPPPEPAPEEDLVVPEEIKKPKPRKVEENPPPDPAPDIVESSAVTADTMPAPTTGDITLDDADFPFMYYLTNIKRKIAAHWNVPGTNAEAKYCVVYFKVLRSGVVQSPMIESPSGSFLFDRSALRAVTQSTPLPPLPNAFKDHYLGVHFSFAYEEE